MPEPEQQAQQLPREQLARNLHEHARSLGLEVGRVIDGRGQAWFIADGLSVSVAPADAHGGAVGTERPLSLAAARVAGCPDEGRRVAEHLAATFGVDDLDANPQGAEFVKRVEAALGAVAASPDEEDQ